MQFGDDERAQAIQIGAVLLFGILIIFLSMYQAFVVPTQNEEIDFNHHLEVERDMVELRGEILQSKTTGEDRFATVRLGTEYPSRILFRNPPDPAGTLATTANRSIEVLDENGQELELVETDENRFIEFRPQYSMFTQAGPIRYENTVLYQQFPGINATITEQRLIRENRVSIIPLHREFQASGRQTVSVEPIPGVLEREEVADPTVRLGTGLSEDDWLEILEREITENDDLYAENVSVENGILELDLKGDFDIEYAPVGMDTAPRGGARGDDEFEINPAAPGDIRLASIESGAERSWVDLTFGNQADTNNFTEARIAFYQSDEGGPQTPEWANVTEGHGNTGIETQLVFTETMRTLEERIELEGDEAETEVNLDFANEGSDNPNLSSDSFFVLEFRLETGERATYFIQVPD